ncbi:AraC family transcriptional regulator [Pseudomonas typographi]|uniref:AraC family transcriptional regulator n=1 Tax=Pseudomonas typographi TaxID=2715964 RepID=UPI001682FCDE|nr:AraC family transcriptional regulator [Pseudomonas typographi]MBD1551436.1 AraC family transcriptional regulator [Pseudomonas typographi]
MDLLTDIVRLMRPQALIWKTFEARGHWGMVVPQRAAPRFSLIAAGKCWYVPETGEPLLMRPGDYLLLTRMPNYLLASSPEVALQLLKPATRSALTDGEGYVRWQGADDGETTRMVGGYFQVAPEHTGLTETLLPPQVHIRCSDEEAGRLSRLLSLIAEEAGSSLPGHELVMSRLLQIMLVEVLRRPLQALDRQQTGWLSGLSDPKVAAALQAMHADVARHWTLATLARHVGMSRSAFVQRFCERVGVAPGTYLVNWRIALAKDTLINSKRSIADIAQWVGYLSDSAFSTAFRRTVGCSPRQFRESAWQ